MFARCTVIAGIRPVTHAQPSLLAQLPCVKPSGRYSPFTPAGNAAFGVAGFCLTPAWATIDRAVVAALSDHLGSVEACCCDIHHTATLAAAAAMNDLDSRGRKRAGRGQNRRT